jgi:hypothetical protein
VNERTSHITFRTKIDEDDLAKVDVTSIDSVADNCGGTSSRK